MNASQILVLTKYSDLFVEDQTESKKIHRNLLKQWHPDRNKDPKANDVFVHINKLYDMKNIKIDEQLLDINGKSYSYYYSVDTSVYEMYYMKDQSMLIKFKAKNDTFKSNFMNNITHLKNYIISSKFKDRYKFITDIVLLENSGYFKIKMDKEFVPLNLLIKYIYDYKDWKLSAYIISRMFDFSMLYNVAGLQYIGCDSNFIFVNTKGHVIHDMSSLFFGIEHGQNLIGITNKQLPAFSTKDIKTKSCSTSTIIDLIKMIGLELAGDINKTGNINILDSASVNVNLIKELNNLDSNTSLIEAYKTWQSESIKRVFTARSFYKKELTINDLVKYLE